MSDKEQKAIQRIKMASEMSLHHYGKPPSFWGCRLYDNEMDARKAFG